VICVLHLRQGKRLYGADRAVLALAKATAPPFRALVGGVSPPGEQCELVDAAAGQGVESIRFDTSSRFDWKCARAVARVVRGRDVRLLHAHDFKTLLVALIAGLIARVPVVATYHGETRSTLSVRLYELVARVLGNFTRAVAAVSQSLQHTLSRWVWIPGVSFVPNGLSPVRPISAEERAAARAQLQLNPDQLVFAVIGRLSEEKGVAFLLAALRKLSGRAPLLLVAGDGPLRAPLEQSAADLRVRWLGYLPEPRLAFAAADALVIPSLTEGLPLVALEAAMLQRPLIATAVGELPSLLRDGAGLLVPPGDAGALAEAIERLSDPALRRSIEAKALLRSRDYAVEATAASYAVLYRRALSMGSVGSIPSSSR
jgi:glycosyltransferase involved in cell wall biosynthesis